VVSALLILLGALTGLSIVLVVSALRPRSPGSLLARTAHRFDPGAPRRALLAVAVGVVTLAITRWPVAGVLAGLATVGLRGLRSDPARVVIARLEAIATWTEMLRDTLAGAAGLSQAIAATSRVAPAAIRGPVEALATRLAAGVSARNALVAFGNDLDDPSIDLIVAALCMATEQRAQRLGDLLGALATTTRDEIAMRLRIEASRASARTSVRTVAGFSLGFLLLLAVLAHSYLAPFGTPAGQVVLAAVGALFGGGLWLMARMARPRTATRLIGDGASAQASAQPQAQPVRS
jgi:tight adherence protein B